MSDADIGEERAGEGDQVGAAIEPEPAPDTITVKVANATHGARWPGDVVTLAADLARSLIREGLAVHAGTAPGWLDVTGR